MPTVWLGLLQHLRASGEKLATVKRIMTGGSAAPPLLIEAFRDEYGVAVEHGWGMTELSPVGTYNAPKPAQAGLAGEPAVRHMLKQGRVLPGIDMKIVDGDGRELPWDGKQFGDLLVRGPWVCSGYFGDAPGSACDADGWFATGDVATIDPDGYMEITDRSKDVIKSGGEWISSITLENIAVSHPDVAEAAVVAAQHPKWDERPLLLVVPRPGHTVDPESVLRIYQGTGGEMVAAGCRGGGERAAAYRDRQAAEDGAAHPLPGLLSESNDMTAERGRAPIRVAGHDELSLASEVNNLHHVLHRDGDCCVVAARREKARPKSVAAHRTFHDCGRPEGRCGTNTKPCSGELIS